MASIPSRSGPGIFAAIGAVILIAVSAVTSTDRSEFAITLVIQLFGAALGWLIGILISPYSPEEGDRFGKYASAVSVFVSGYLVAKIDPLIERLFDPSFVITRVAGLRALGFVTAFILALIFGHAARSYAPYRGPQGE